MFQVGELLCTVTVVRGALAPSSREGAGVAPARAEAAPRPASRTEAGKSPDPRAVADLVYRLMIDDLRRARERE